jgi:hypothetical protein
MQAAMLSGLSSVTSRANSSIFSQLASITIEQKTHVFFPLHFSSYIREVILNQHYHFCWGEKGLQKKVSNNVQSYVSLEVSE